VLAQPVETENDATPTDSSGPRELVAWLKRVTPEWPPMGVDWPLVLGKAERLWPLHSAAEPWEGEMPREGQEISDFLRGCLDQESFRQADSYTRGYGYAVFLLDGFAMLEAYCTASLFIGYDLDAIERPVKQLPPFYRLMCLGWTMVEWVRCLR